MTALLYYMHIFRVAMQKRNAKRGDNLRSTDQPCAVSLTANHGCLNLTLVVFVRHLATLLLAVCGVCVGDVSVNVCVRVCLLTFKQCFCFAFFRVMAKMD